MTSRCCSLLISDVDLGAAAPTRRSQSIATGGSIDDVGLTALADSPMTSPRRRSIVVALGVMAIAPAVTSSDTNRNAISGRNSITSHLDLHHLANPEVANHLHDKHAFEHDVAQMLAEQRRHVFGIDQRQRDRQKRRQAQQYEPGKLAVRRMDANLPQNLEPLAHHMRQVVKNLRQVAAGVALD